jgi:hypothetical protein
MAPAETVFDLLERDRTEFKNDELIQRRALGSLCFGPGYRFEATVSHGGKRCSSITRITVCRRPFVLQEEWEHYCEVAGRKITGSQRFELLVDAAGTTLVCELAQRRPGLGGALDDLLRFSCKGASAKAAHLGMRAEARAHSTQG